MTRTPLLPLLIPLALAVLAGCQERTLPTALAPEGAGLAALPVGCDVGALIAAIETANSTAAPDTLELAAGCTYTLTHAYSGDNGLPIIPGDLTINGNGATIRRSSDD